MNKVIYFILCAAVASIAWLQELHVASGRTIYVSPTSHLFIKTTLNITAGSVTVISDASSSGALNVEGAATGTITYKRYVAATGTSWHLVSAPVGTQDIGIFAVTDVATNGIRANGAKYAVARYNNNNADGMKWGYHSTSPAAETYYYV